jgi:hypothetical protein
MYHDVDLERAAELFHAAIALGGVRAGCDAREPALAFLAATEIHRNDTSAAREAFRDLILANPRYRLDEIVFPPEVTSFFEETRRETRVVALVVPSEVDLRAGSDSVEIRIHASTAHAVRAYLTTGMLPERRLLFVGVASDSVAVWWDGRDAKRRPVPDGTHWVEVTSLGPGGDEERTTRIRVGVRRIAAEESPSSDPPGNGWQTAAGSGAALAAGLTVAVLPSLVGMEGSGARFVVAGALSAASIGGLIRAWTSRAPSLRQPVLNLRFGDPSGTLAARSEGRP